MFPLCALDTIAGMRSPFYLNIQSSYNRVLKLPVSRISVASCCGRGYLVKAKARLPMNTVKQGIGFDHEPWHQLALVIENQHVGIDGRAAIIQWGGVDLPLTGRFVVRARTGRHT